MAVYKKMVGKIIVLICLVCIATCLPCEPYAVRLALGMNYMDEAYPTKLVIRFNTADLCQRSYVEFHSSSGFGQKVYCVPNLLSFHGYASYVQTCSIDHLIDGESFIYSVFGWTGRQSDDKISYVESSIPSHLPNFKQDDFTAVVLADWGELIEERDIYAPLEDLFDRQMATGANIDALIILGDVAYDLDSNNGSNYEGFIRMLSQVSSRWPIIFVPGNHERLTKQDRQIFYLSFENYDFDRNGVSTLHLPYFNLFMYDPYNVVFLNETGDQLFATFKREIAIQTQKGLTLTAGHYPFLCSGVYKDCVDKPNKQMRFFQEMIKNNVPLYLGAHYHAYERSYPYTTQGEFNLVQSPYTWNYDDPVRDMEMVTMINGIAGSDTLLDGPDRGVVQDFTAATSYNITGFGVLRVSAGELNFVELVSGVEDPVDEFKIVLKRREADKHLLVKQ